MSSPPMESKRSSEHSEGQDSVAGRVSGVVAQANGRREVFLQLLGKELAQAFALGIVAISAKEWDSPMMLVLHQQQGNEIDRGKIRHLLQAASVVPVACDVPMVAESSAKGLKTRGLQIEVTDHPDRVAMLLCYAPGDSPTTLKQIADLKLLSRYVDEIREQLKSFVTNPPSTELVSARDLDERQSLQIFHQDLNVSATASRIANESRRLLGADRVTVLLTKGKRLRVQAVSGVAVVDRRSNAVRCIERLCDRASVLSSPLAVPQDDLAPQIQEPMDEYLDIACVSGALLLPLRSPGTDDDLIGSAPFECTGKLQAMIVLEYFAGDPPRLINSPINTISAEATLALKNAQEHHQIMGLGLWKAMGAATRAVRSPLVAAALLAVVGLLAAGLIVKIDHQVIATGTAVPAGQQHVFATQDGVVKEILCQDGQLVQAGDALIVLENAELESQAESLSGEIIATTKQLSSIHAVRLNPGLEPSQVERLVLQERQLESELKNLRAQADLIAQQRTDLTIRSPIDGKVIAWQLERRLGNRPVSRGNVLMSVVDQNGPWNLKLELPDRDSGGFFDAMKDESELPIRFAVATVPGETYDAKLESVATSTRLDESGLHVIDLVANVNQSVSQTGGTFSPQDVKVGANVTAKISCGRRTIIRSWFSDVFDFVDRNLLFYLR